MERDWRAVRQRCDRFLSSKRPESARALLTEVAESLPDDELPDRYGEGGAVTALEERVAALLGHEAAVVMPTGTMAQQAAVRVWCDRRGLPAIAFHPTSHLELHEERAYAHLHGLRAALVGDAGRPLRFEDLDALAEPVAALVLELPQRELGGVLPEWSELVAQTEWARARGVALHLDGARLWECGPYYGRPYDEVARLFGTVYVSFYKGLGGLAGCALAGPADVVAEARLWQTRHGGKLFQIFPVAASAALALDRVLPRMAELLAHARAVAAAVREVPGVEVVPDPPQTPLFHVHARLGDDRAVAAQAALAVAEETGIWFGGIWGTDTFVQVGPGVQKLELTIGEPALEVTPEEARALFARLVERCAAF